jgi:hypothetical protein
MTHPGEEKRGLRERREQPLAHALDSAAPRESPMQIERDRGGEASATALQYPHDRAIVGARDVEPQCRG